MSRTFYLYLYRFCMVLILLIAFMLIASILFLLGILLGYSVPIMAQMEDGQSFGLFSWASIIFISLASLLAAIGITITVGRNILLYDFKFSEFLKEYKSSPKFS